MYPAVGGGDIIEDPGYLWHSVVTIDCDFDIYR